MDRREMLKSFVPVPFVRPVPPEIHAQQEPIRGVGILRHPARPDCLQAAKDVIGHIRSGSILALPNTRDWKGDWDWDFTIVGGDPSEVQVERA